MQREARRLARRRATAQHASTSGTTSSLLFPSTPFFPFTLTSGGCVLFLLQFQALPLGRLGTGLPFAPMPWSDPCPPCWSFSTLVVGCRGFGSMAVRHAPTRLLLTLALASWSVHARVVLPVTCACLWPRFFSRALSLFSFSLLSRVFVLLFPRAAGGCALSGWRAAVAALACRLRGLQRASPLDVAGWHPARDVRPPAASQCGAVTAVAVHACLIFPASRPRPPTHLIVRGRQRRVRPASTARVDVAC